MLLHVELNLSCTARTCIAGVHVCMHKSDVHEIPMLWQVLTTTRIYLTAASYDCPVLTVSRPIAYPDRECAVKRLH